MKLTWPEVTDIKNSRYTNRRYLCPYCTLRISMSLDLWCVLDRLSNFEKCNLRSGHLMWPGGVTFGVIGSSFFGNVPNLGYGTAMAMANLAALCAAVFSLSAKNLRGGGADHRPLAVRGLKINGSKRVYVLSYFSVPISIDLWIIMVFIGLCYGYISWRKLGSTVVLAADKMYSCYLPVNKHK